MGRMWHKNVNTAVKSMATKKGKREGALYKISTKSGIYIPNTCYETKQGRILFWIDVTSLQTFVSQW